MSQDDPAVESKFFMQPPIYLAMWSGPRNISTAMMRSWENRADTFVTDEPLYAHYLQQTRLPHPGAEEVIAAGEIDWRKVAAWLTGPIPEGKGVWYQKHMAHHLLPEIETGWLDQLTHAFLIRHPREMLESLLEFIPQPVVTDTGLPQQTAIFRRVAETTGRVPPVVDARDVLENPRGILSRLCDAVGVEFTESMLHWPAGRRATDGVWAKYWYAKVEPTTSFGPYRPKEEEVPAELAPLLAECLPLYEELRRHRLLTNA